MDHCRIFIGGNELFGNSFKGTVVPLANRFESSMCFEDMTSNLPEYLLYLPSKIGNVSTTIEPLSKLCEKEGEVLVVNEKSVNGHNAIQTDYCQLFGGRYFKYGEIEILQGELLMEVKRKCPSRKREESTLVWTEEPCIIYDLVTLKRIRSCFPIHACFLCFIPKPNITLKSDKLGNFTDIILAESIEKAGHFFLESEHVTIKHHNETWHLDFKHIRDKYYLNSSTLPFGEKKWHSHLAEEVTEVISIDNCLNRQRCQDGTCYTRLEKCRSKKYCKDGSDEIICEEGFPYFLEAIEKYRYFGGYNLDTCFQYTMPKRRFSNNKVHLDYDVSLAEVRDVKLEDKELEIALRFSFAWKDTRIEFHETKRQEINGSRLPFRPSTNLVLANCGLRGQNFPLNISNSKFGISPDPFDAVLWNNFTAAFHLPCQFLYQDFPFGGQFCNFCLSIKGCDLLNAEYKFKRNIIFNTSKIIGAFLLRNISQRLLHPSLVQIRIQLETSPRLSNYHTLTSFIPTLLMCFIAYCTLFFHMRSFAERIGLSATSLLTLVVLFTDASERIGVVTSYAKFIDSWFIGSITYTAIVVVINALLHYLFWHRLHNCKCLNFSFCKGYFKRGGTGSMDINLSEMKVEDGPAVEEEECDMGNPAENHPPMNEASANSGDELEDEAHLSSSIGRKINLGSRVLLLATIVGSVIVLLTYKGR